MAGPIVIKFYSPVNDSDETPRAVELARRHGHCASVVAANTIAQEVIAIQAGG